MVSTAIVECLKDVAFSPSRWCERLIERANHEQWQIDEHVDWPKLGIEAIAPSIRRAMVPLYTQLHYGEIVGLGLVAKIRDRIPEPWAKALAAAQETDEARHVEFFTRVLARLGQPGTVTPSVKRLCDELESLEDPNELLLGEQVVLEGYAKCLFEEASPSRPIAKRRVRLSSGPERLLEVISSLVSRDESRHLAFGLLYLRDRWSALTVRERTRLQDLGHRLSRMLEVVVLDMDNDLKRVGLSTARLQERVRCTQCAHFRKIGFEM
jgi:hypothetical protein